MKRTQIYLPEELHEKVRRISFEQRKSMAQVVREAVVAYVVEEQASAPAAPAREENVEDIGEIEPISEEDLTPEELAELKKNPLYHIIGMVSSGLTDLSENHDYYAAKDPH